MVENMQDEDVILADPLSLLPKLDEPVFNLDFDFVFGIGFGFGFIEISLIIFDFVVGLGFDVLILLIVAFGFEIVAFAVDIGFVTTLVGIFVFFIVLKCNSKKV